MFNGIIKHKGKFVKLVPSQNDYFVLTISAPSIASELGIGDSVCVNGACLTVVKIDAEILSFDLLQETLQKTNLGSLLHDSVINLEVSLRMSDYMSGHLVAGHVDFCTALVEIKDQEYVFELPDQFKHLLACKGAITINGVALTSCNVTEKAFSVYLIPETLDRTNLSCLSINGTVNVEVDMLARYVERILTYKK